MPDWRIPVAVLAVSGLLLGSAAVTTQVASTIDGFGDANLLQDLSFSESFPISLNDVELPEDVDATLPEGTRVDGSQVKLGQAMDVDVPSGMPLPPVGLTLPEDFALDLPPGSVVDAEGVDLARGANVRLPDGGSVDVPPGTRLDLPPEAMAQLADAGVPEGPLPEAATVPVSDLPEDALAQVRMPESGGAVTLPAGTVLDVPPEALLGLADGVLDAPQDVVLPAGTRVGWPALNGDAASAFPVTEGALGTDALAGAPVAGAPCPSCADVALDALPAPGQVGKAASLPVEGVVTNPQTDAPLSGVPVDAYLNASGADAGRFLGRAVTDAHGRYALDAAVPPDVPAGAYDLVTHVNPSRVDGQAFAEAWTRSALDVTSASALTLDAPAADGVGARVPLSGMLLDESGAPVANAPVLVDANGERVARLLTDAAGAWATEATFDEPGEHEVLAHFPGNEHLASASTGTKVNVARVGVDVPPDVTVPRGQETVLEGRVLSAGELLQGARVNVDAPGGVVSAVTDADGAFDARVAIPADAAPGESRVTYRVDGHKDAVKAQRLLVTAPGTWHVDAPDLLRPGADAAARVWFTPSDDAPVAEAPARVTWTGPGGVSSWDLNVGAEPVAVPLEARAAGAYTLTVESASPAIDAAPVTRTVTAAALDVRWQLPAHAVRGEDVALAGRVVTVGGDPFAGERVRVTFLEERAVTTDADGGFRVTVPVPPDMDPGPRNVSLHVHGHDGALGHASLPVKVRTSLAFDAPRKYVAGDEVRVTVTLLDDRGEPLNGPVAATFVDTDARAEGDGVARLTHAPEWGDAVVRSSFPGDAHHLPANGERVIPESGMFGIAGLTVTHVASGGGAFLLVGVAAVAGTWAVRRRFHARAKAAAVPAEPEEVPLTFPDLEPDLPRVFAPGERVRVQAPEPVKWTFADASLPVSAEAVLGTRETGEILLAVEAPDGRRTRTRVRVSPYEREIARGFDELLDAACDLAPGLTVKSTAREVEAALLPVTPEGERDALADAVHVLEITNYSDAAVERDAFARFHRAKERLVAAYATLPRPEREDEASG